jgi:hypothetical protein
MGGIGSRTKSYNAPKPFIQVDQTYLFEKALNSVLRIFPNINPFAIMSKANFEYSLKNNINFGNVQPICLPRETFGPAETVRLVDIEYGKRFLVVDCDLEFQASQFDFSLDCLILTSNSNNPGHSYIVRNHSDQKVLKIVEKRVVSTESIVGLYGFKDKDFYNRIYDSIKFVGEPYLSEIINKSISEGFDLQLEKCTSTRSFGTSKEIQSYLQSQKGV